jgi:hypothetical protein
LTGEAIPDQRIVEKVLRSLPNKFEMVVTAILESKDLSKFSTDELMGSLLTHETRLHLEDESIANAFKTQFSFSRGRGRGRGRVTKEEGEVQVTITQVKVTDNKTRIRISKVTDNRTRIIISSLKEAEGEDQMKNQTYNAITAKIMGTMNLNVGRSKQSSLRQSTCLKS